MYTHGGLRMRQVHAEYVRDGAGVQERAKRMYALRDALRTWTRTLMSDTALAKWLQANERSPTFEQLVALHQARGLTGESVYVAIITSSTRSRPSVNTELGIDPEAPPPLPPLRC